jgi:type IV pilus assembly protein PilQ
MTASRLVKHAASFVSFVALASVSFLANAQGGLRLEAIDVQPLGGQQVELRLRLSGAAPEPTTFSSDDPARIVLDLPNTENALQVRRQDVNAGPLTNIATAEANGRTRVQLSMTSLAPYETRIEGNTLVVTIGQAAGAAPPPAFAAQPRSGAPSALPAFTGPSTIENIDFRRGTDGAGQILVDLSDPRTTIDVRE